MHAAYTAAEGMRAIPLGLLVLVALLFAACDANEEPALTEDEAKEVAAVMAYMLSEKGDGVVADLNDLTADVTSFSPGTASKQAGAGKQADAEAYWHVAYDCPMITLTPESGTFAFECGGSADAGNSGGGFSKSIKIALTYVFTDADGAPVDVFGEHRDDVASIGFDGTRSGTVALRSTFLDAEAAFEFDRKTDWALTGVQEAEMILAGTQTHEHTFRIEYSDTTRVYEDALELNLVGITIKKEEAGDVEERISGEIAYEMVRTVTVNGERQEERTIRGAVEFEGDGHALLRIEGAGSLYRVDLQNGEVDPAEDV